MYHQPADREALKSVIKEVIADAMRDDPTLLREAVGAALKDLASGQGEAPTREESAPRSGAYYDIMDGWE